MWINELTDRRLTRGELRDFLQRARQLYDTNRHIFEDELDALAAIGVVPSVALRPAEGFLSEAS